MRKINKIRKLITLLIIAKYVIKNNITIIVNEIKKKHLKTLMFIINLSYY